MQAGSRSGQGREDFALVLDEICRRGAERMLAIALVAEVVDEQVVLDWPLQPCSR